jgi:hypothetical protein
MMLSPVVLFALLALVQFDTPIVYSCHRQTSCGCSEKSRMHSKIIGGQTVRTRTWSWVVSIRVRDRFQCAGSLLSSSWILTAAHCFSFVSNSGVNILPSSITVHAGSNDRRDENQLRQTADVFIHPQFDPSSFVNDIALIKVSSPFDMTDTTVGQICLPSRSAVEYPPVNSSVSQSQYRMVTTRLQCLPCLARRRWLGSAMAKWTRIGYIATSHTASH